MAQNLPSLSKEINNVMRNIYYKTVTSIVLCLFSTLLYSQNNNEKSEKYKVIKIDSTKNNYLVYVKKREKKYLIISLKTNITNKIKPEYKKIEKNKKYELDLKLFDVKLTGMIEDNTVSVDSKVVWKKGDDFDLYITKSLIGLYYAPFGNGTD
jgi:hypothetical protein